MGFSLPSNTKARESYIESSESFAKKVKNFWYMLLNRDSGSPRSEFRIEPEIRANFGRPFMRLAAALKLESIEGKEINVNGIRRVRPCPMSILWHGPKWL